MADVLGRVCFFLCGIRRGGRYLKEILISVLTFLLRRENNPIVFVIQTIETKALWDPFG